MYFRVQALRDLHMHNLNGQHGLKPEDTRWSITLLLYRQSSNTELLVSFLIATNKKKTTKNFNKIYYPIFMEKLSIAHCINFRITD